MPSSLSSCECRVLSEDAVEHDELDIFLRLKEEWDPSDDLRPAPEAKPVGIPGAMTPLQMTPDHLKKKIIATQSASASASPLRGKGTPVNKMTDRQLDMGDELSGYGLQGVKATMDELRALVEELGLDGEDAGDLVKGLSNAAPPAGSEIKKQNVESKEKDSAPVEKAEEKSSEKEPVAAGEEKGTPEEKGTAAKEGERATNKVEASVPKDEEASKNTAEEHKISTEKA